MDFSRNFMLWAQIILDLIGALSALYIALIITQAFGLGSWRARLQLLHRFTLVMVSLGFAWHVEDLVNRPDAHGLTGPNVFLHLSFILMSVVSAIRFRRFQRQQGETNGGHLVGPFEESRRKGVLT